MRYATRVHRGRRVAAAAALLALAVGATGCAAPGELKRDLDAGHATLSRGLADAVDGLDRAFGERRIEDRERIARLKAGVRLTLRENEGPGYSVPISLRVPLPALERRANIFLQYEAEADISSGLDEAASSLDRNRSISATLLTRVLERVENGVRLELTWRDGPQTGFRPFLRWEWRPDPLRFAVEQQVYYLTDKGFGARSLLQGDRVLSGQSFVRLRAILEGSQDTPGTDSEYAIIYRRPFAPWDVALSAEVGVTANSYEGDPQTRTHGAENDPDQGFAQLRVIGTVLRPWLEYEITPALFRPWRHRDNFEYGVTFTLRIVAEHALPGPEAP